MGDYVCVKPVFLSGTYYAPGERIPEGTILSSRVLALKRSGYIADAPAGEEKGSKGEGTQITIPIHAESGATLEAVVNVPSLSRAIDILQMSVKEARTAVQAETDCDALMLLDALDRRKDVLSAVKERVVALTEGGGSDGEEVHI